MKQVKTLAMRVLEGHGVPYAACYYDVEEHLPAEQVAAAIGLPPEQVFKTLVTLPATPGAKPVLALIPAGSQLDLKKLAEAVGEKKMQMAAQREAERLTGLEKGGISPLALMDRGYRIAMDETATLFDRIELSAGRVGAGVIVPVEGLLRILRPALADLSQES
jgi:Cys-tRNA(Pro)/Cys-tRNA(Cys) deacylase